MLTSLSSYWFNSLLPLLHLWFQLSCLPTPTPIHLYLYLHVFLLFNYQVSKYFFLNFLSLFLLSAPIHSLKYILTSLQCTSQKPIQSSNLIYPILLPTMSLHMQLILLICGWRQQDPLQRQYTYSRVHTITYQQIAIAQNHCRNRKSNILKNIWKVTYCPHYIVVSCLSKSNIG